jgi:hypothetical protein
MVHDSVETISRTGVAFGFPLGKRRVKRKTVKRSKNEEGDPVNRNRIDVRANGERGCERDPLHNEFITGEPRSNKWHFECRQTITMLWRRMSFD